MDRLSNLPDHVVDRILCSLPLPDVVKTCVLSRVWRYKWVTLSKLIFDKKFWEHIKKGEETEVYTAILLQHIGQLQELYLSAYWGDDLKRKEVLDASIQFALRKGVTRLSLELSYDVYLPSCVYSSVQLTHLELQQVCDFSPPASFNGLPNLISFKLDHSNSVCSAHKIENFISRCPNVQRVWLDIVVDEELEICAPKLEYLTVCGICQCIWFQEIKNLRYLDVRYHVYISNDFYEKCQKNYNCLVKLEHLVLGYSSFQHLVSSDAGTKFLLRLDQLKILELCYLNLKKSNVLQGLLCLFASSPNLCKLTMLQGDTYSHCDDVDFESYVDLYRDHKFASLHTVEVHTRGSKLDIKMIGFLLRCSPSLEIMSIHCSCKDIVSTLKEVTSLTRASPKASVKFL